MREDQKEDVVVFGMKQKLENPGEIERCAYELDLQGYTKIESGYTAQQLDEFTKRMETVMETQRAESGGAENMKTTYEAHFVRCLLGYDDHFIQVCRHPKILQIVEKVIGAPVYLNEQNAVINPPSEASFVSSYHRDIAWQHFVSSSPLSLTILLCLDDFTEENGATRVIPGSHKVKAFPDEQTWREYEVAVTAKRGSFLVFDSMTFHRVGKNTTDKFRRSVVQIYTIPLFKQVISLPSMLGDKYKDDKELAQFFGYPYESARSVLEFRRKRGFAK